MYCNMAASRRGRGCRLKAHIHTDAIVVRLFNMEPAIKVEDEEAASAPSAAGSASNKFFGASLNQYRPSDADYWIPALDANDKDKRYVAVGKLAELSMTARHCSE